MPACKNCLFYKTKIVKDTDRGWIVNGNITKRYLKKFGQVRVYYCQHEEKAKLSAHARSKDCRIFEDMDNE